MRWIRLSYSSFAPRVEHAFWGLHGLILLGLTAWLFLSWSHLIITSTAVFVVAGYLALLGVSLLLTRSNVLSFGVVFWPILSIDLFVVGWMIQLDGGMSSNFYLLFFALVPFVAFYQGLRSGMIAAGIVAVCYYVMALPHIEPAGIPNFAFRAIMLGLFTVAMGFSVKIIRQSEGRLLNALDKLNERTTELERTHSQLETIYETSRELAQILDVENVVDKVLHIARSVLNYPVCEIYTWDSVSKTLMLKGRVDPEQSARFQEPRRVQLNDSLRRVIEKREVVRVIDRHAGRTIIDGHPYRSQLMVPMISEGKVVGLLSAESPNVNAFGSKEESVLSILAASTALALVNADLHEKLEKLVIKDELTGLFNYRHFRSRLEDERRRAVRYSQPLSLLMVDIDWFKRLNDQHGHEIGNMALQHLSRVIESCVREVDVVARYGGEEFIVILPQTGLDEAQTIAERIRRTVEELKIIAAPGAPPITLTVSVGVTCYPDNGRSENYLVDSVDQALYRAKGAGKNLVCTV